MGYFAEVAANEVTRVVVAGSAEWCADHLGGVWVETSDPYGEPTEVAYCSPGFGFDPVFPARFARKWVQPVAGVPIPGMSDGTVGWGRDEIVFHNGRIWRSTLGQNVWEPGVSGWHDSPATGLSEWVQPTGAHDSYGLDTPEDPVRVTYNGQSWRSTVANNVWAPGVYGWEMI